MHAGAVNECKVRVVPIHAEELEGSYKSVGKSLDGLNGILVAPGFGARGIEGKLMAIRYAREHKVPFFGICLGMQCACVEFARNVLGLADAASTEVDDKTQNPIIDLMEGQKDLNVKGGTMRLGAYPCDLKKKTKTYEAYHTLSISERHRHRWEFNDKYREAFEKAGMVITGINPETNLVEIVELKDHPWFIGVQFHPELKSTVENPHPLFVDFVKAAVSKI